MVYNILDFRQKFKYRNDRESVEIGKCSQHFILKIKVKAYLIILMNLIYNNEN